MNLEQAITTAIEYETKVYKTYLEAMDQAVDEVGKRVFKTLCEEEKGHLKYLSERLSEWKENGAITVAELDTAIPSRQAIAEGVERLKEKVEGAPSAKHDLELQLLQRALQVEVETSEFYKSMVLELDAEGQEMFRRFVEIEEGHQAIVQAEIDCVNGLGFWFDTPEFNLEAF
jgi:rubrerythrin